MQLSFYAIDLKVCCHVRFQFTSTEPGNTVYKWEGSDYRWSCENLARLQTQKIFSVLLKTTQIFPGTNGRDPSRYDIQLSLTEHKLLTNVL